MQRKDNLKTGCPVACGYCAVTNVANRSCLWEKSTIAGLNKAVTYINPPPDKDSAEAMQDFYNFPFELLEGDIVGFQAISDPFWRYYDDERSFFLEKAAPVAKLVTCVTKFPIRDKVMQELAEIDNFRLAVSITGLDTIEKTTTQSRLKTLQKAKDYGVKALPVIHPYISGMSDLSFLPELKRIGYDYVDLKGFRYTPETMQHWMPKASRAIYGDKTSEEYLPEDGWRDKIDQSGLKLISLKDWYKTDIDHSKGVSREKAEELVRRVVGIANITSSDSNEAVISSSIKRRLSKEYQ